MTERLPIVAIVGRPNVGKSTLYNRLAGRRMAIVSDVPGTTRDRVSTDASWEGRRYMLVDTGGIEDRPGSVLWEEVRIQTERALEQADGVILVVDAISGVMPADEDAADLVRRSDKPAVVAVNKTDNIRQEAAAPEFYPLGAGEPIPVSAYHDSGISDLMNELFGIMTVLPEEGEAPGTIRIAIAGRPNVGKSALFNSITGEQRAIVSPIPGTTRDAIDSRFSYEGTDLTFLDTAGLRRRGKAEDGIEKYSGIRSIGAIERSHVCLIVLDATEFVTAQDTHIGGFVDDAARAGVIAINKWDLADDQDREVAVATVRERFKFLPEVPVLFTSALTGAGVPKILPAITSVHDEFSKSVPRSDLNRLLFDAMGQNPLPGHGPRRPRIYRVSQPRVAPPTFLFACRNPDLIHFSYRRYLENRLRQEHGFAGSPMRLQFRARDE